MSEDVSAADPALVEMIRREILDSYDEELEQELEDNRLDTLGGGPRGLDRRFYFRELLRLQHELVRLQDWVQAE